LPYLTIINPPAGGKNKNKNMEKLKAALNKDLFESDHNEEGRFSILLSLVPLLVLTFFMNFGII